MKMLFLILLFSASVAIDIPSPGITVMTYNRQLSLEMYNKSYYKNAAIVPVYTKRVRKYEFRFTLLKPWTKKFWFDLRFYHFRNNRYHPFPMNLGLPIEEMFTRDYYGMGTSIKKCMGQNLPYLPKNYTIIFDYIPNSTTFAVPMLGDYRFEVVVNDGDFKTAAVTQEVGTVEIITPKKCVKC